jgi:hypothetical protein
MLCGPLNARVDFAAKRAEIERLGKKPLGTTLQCLAYGFLHRISGKTFAERVFFGFAF